MLRPHPIKSSRTADDLEVLHSLLAQERGALVDLAQHLHGIKMAGSAL